MARKPVVGEPKPTPSRKELLRQRVSRDTPDVALQAARRRKAIVALSLMKKDEVASGRDPGANTTRTGLRRG